MTYNTCKPQSKISWKNGWGFICANVLCSIWVSTNAGIIPEEDL